MGYFAKAISILVFSVDFYPLPLPALYCYYTNTLTLSTKFVSKCDFPLCQQLHDSLWDTETGAVSRQKPNDMIIFHNIQNLDICCIMYIGKTLMSNYNIKLYHNVIGQNFEGLIEDFFFFFCQQKSWGLWMQAKWREIYHCSFADTTNII